MLFAGRALETTTGKVEKGVLRFVVLCRQEAWRCIVIQPDALNNTFGDQARSGAWNQPDRPSLLRPSRFDQRRSKRSETRLE